MDLYIRGRTSKDKMLRSQYNYCKGRFVDTAPHTIVSHMEGALIHKEYTGKALHNIDETLTM